MLLTLLACSAPLGSHEMDLALGALLDIEPDMVCTGLGCAKPMVEVRDVVAEDPAVVDFSEYDDSVVTLQGLGEGQSVVTIVGLTASREVIERHLDVRVAAVDSFDGAPRCDDSLSESNAVTAGSELYWLFHKRDSEGQELLGEPELDFGGLELSELLGDSAWLVAPETTGTYRITSSLYVGVIDEIEVVEAVADSLEILEPVPQLVAGSGSGVGTLVTVGGELPCVEDLLRTATIATPEICSFELLEELNETSFSSEGVTIWANEPGICELTVRVGELSETVELEVLEAE